MLQILLISLVIGMLKFQCNVHALTKWTHFVTSTNYTNTKLVIEASNPFQPHYISKDKSSAMMAQMMCSQICARESRCVAFNFYSIATHYVCELLPENFCVRTQRVALQAWPGGQVWDKVTPGIKSACVDQKFVTNTTSNYCEIGRSGCGSVWPNCDTCVQSCKNCTKLYNRTGYYDCTLWPEGPFKRPIFGFCNSASTILIQRRVYLINQGYAWPNYLMPFEDMNRLHKLGVYRFLKFHFNNTRLKNYTASYRNFVIDKYGTLSNMTFVTGSGNDGFNTKLNSLKPSPFIWDKQSYTYNCGPFWLLNSTMGTAANEYCPGGGVNMFGNIIITWYSSDTGIKWPQATRESINLYYAEMKMD